MLDDSGLESNGGARPTSPKVAFQTTKVEASQTAPVEGLHHDEVVGHNQKRQRRPQTAQRVFTYSSREITDHKQVVGQIDGGRGRRPQTARIGKGVGVLRRLM